jgi:hypothetical protein
MKIYEILDTDWGFICAMLITGALLVVMEYVVVYIGKWRK